jgi:hypothetical protein
MTTDTCERVGGHWMTVRARYSFVVKESRGGEFSIAMEPRASALPVIQHGTLGSSSWMEALSRAPRRLRST